MMWANERKWDRELLEAARAYGIPSALLRAIVGAESSYNPAAFRSEPQIKDASRGLAQLLERTARALGYTGEVGDSARLSGLFDPRTNLTLAAKLLAENLSRARPRAGSGDSAVDVAISAYNAGFSTDRPGDAKRDGTGQISNRDYVARVKRYLAYFEELEAREARPSFGDVTGGSSSSSAPGELHLAPLTVGLVLAAILLLFLLAR